MPAREDEKDDRTNRTRLLQSAADAFAESGYEGASLRSIADAAGVSFQLIQHYFGTKDALWAAAVDYLYERYLETGKGLGFDPFGNVQEQFRTHLRLLLSDLLQRPQMRKIWIQEYFAGGARYSEVVFPRIQGLYKQLALPYYREVVRLGIVKHFSPEEISLLVASVFQNNVAYPAFVALAVGASVSSPKSIERQVDLLFHVLTGTVGKSSTESEARASIPNAVDEESTHASTRAAVVYASRSDTASLDDVSANLPKLEAENRRLKALVGQLTLEKHLLLEQARARDAAVPASTATEAGIKS
jgi:TetR/AcrR family transcriptional regulator